MTKRMLIDASHQEETRVVVADGTRIDELDFESSAKRQLRGNVYLARVTRVEPSLQAAFVEYGGNRHGFLAFSEIHPDYYQIPYEDRMALLQAEEEDAIAQAEEEDAEVDAAAEKESETPADVLADDDSDTNSDADDSDDEGIKPIKKPRRQSNRRRYKIQEVVKRGQILLIQVVKEERGNKGAAMTTYLSLAGRYCVLMPNTPRGGGISRKISNSSDRKHLKAIVSDLKVPKGIGVIVRTAGAKRTKTEIKRDYDYLSRLWETIRDKTLKSIAPSLIHEEGDLVKRSIRDLYDKDISEILVQGDAAYKDAKTFIKMLMPSHAKNVKAYKENIPLFLRYGIEQQLENSLSSLVQLKSGGYLVIHPTEALVSIDVNSGRSTKERNVERTALKTNLEAVDEVARQMRLRDLAGLIVIDFIDMNEYKNNRSVQNRMKDALSKDRARVQAGKISQFGLMEISRQRRRRSLLDASTISCEHCGGVGRQRSTESSALRALRAAAEIGVRGKAARIRLRVTPDVALYIINEKRTRLDDLQDSYDMFTELYADSKLLKPNFEIDVLTSRSSENGDPLEEIEKQHRKERQDQEREAAKTKKSSSDKKDDQKAKTSEAKDEDDDQPRRRRRGRRGGRRRNSENSKVAETHNTESENDTSDENKANDGQTKDVGAKAAPTETTSKTKRDGRRKAPSRAVVSDSDKSTKTAAKTETTSEKQADDQPDSTVKKSRAKSTTRRAAPKRKAPTTTKTVEKKTAQARSAQPKTTDTKVALKKSTSASTSRRKAPARKPITDDETKTKVSAPKKVSAPRKTASKAKAATKTKTTAKKATAPRTRKAPVKKAPAKTVTAKKAPAKATAKTTAPKKPSAKSTTAKKTPTKTAAAKKATTKAVSAKGSETTTAKRTRKAPVRKAASIESPETLTTEAATLEGSTPKKPKKRSWLKRLTGGDKS